MESANLSEKDVAVEMSCETIPLTLEVAKHYDRMRTLKGDRDPDSPRGKGRVAKLHEILRAGFFHSPSWSTVSIRGERGNKYRVDGGHSARMLVQAGVDFPEGLSVCVHQFEAKTIEGAIDLYEQFNQQLSTRSMTDLIKNRAAYEEELDGIPPTNIGYAIAGIGVHLSLWNPRQVFEIRDFIQTYPTFIAWANHFVAKRELRKPGVIGAMFSTYNRDREPADTFWKMVRDESGATPECPTRVLSKFLHDVVMEHARVQKWSARAHYTKCHHAWSAWRRGGTTALKYIEGSPLPEPV